MGFLGVSTSHRDQPMGASGIRHWDIFTRLAPRTRPQSDDSVVASLPSSPGTTFASARNAAERAS